MTVDHVRNADWRQPRACWEPRDAVAVIPIEAESPPDATFLATHSPMPLVRRRDVTSLQGGEPATEDDLLRTVITQPGDEPVLPILGRSGSGKSHLVRWLRLQLANAEELANTRLVFIPKHRTSLRGIVEAVLEHGEGEVFSELRTRVETAVDALGSEEEARARLLSELRLALQFSSAIDSAASDEENELREYLREALPPLLADPYFANHYFLVNGSVIAHITKEKLEGRSPEDKEEPYAFDADGIRPSADDTNRAAVAARDIAGVLYGDEDLRDLAARMLNEQLPAAIGAVFGLKGDDLKELLLQLRRELHGRGEDLLLLIEDFSMFQGLQGGLFDAMSLISSAENPLCALRAVLAVTTGYWVAYVPNTVKTRSHMAYDLEVERGRWDVSAFSARYLNAVRWGEQRLAESAARGEELGSVCDTCQVVAQCHEAFGDVEGVGLFPFSRVSLDRAVAAVAGGEPVARDVLKEILRPVLHLEHASIEAEEFPTETFETRFRGAVADLLDIEQIARLRNAAEEEREHQRRVRLVRFYSSDPGAHNLSETTHAAFAVRPHPGLEVGPTSAPRDDEWRPEPTPTDGSTTTAHVPHEPKAAAGPPPLVMAVDRWIAQDNLSQTNRSELRKLIHAAVMTALRTEDGRWRPSTWATRTVGSFFPETGVLLGKAPPPQAQDAVVLGLPSAENEDARAIRALAWRASVDSWREVPRGHELQALVTVRAVAWAEQVTAQLRYTDDDADPELAVTAHLLRFGAAAIGAGATKSEPEARMAELVIARPDEDAPEPLEGAGRIRDVVLAPLTEKDKKEGRNGREALIEHLKRLAGYAQGLGSVSALDVPRIERALRRQTPAAQTPGLSKELAALARQVEAITERSLPEMNAEAEHAIPPLDLMGDDTVDALRTSVNALIDKLQTVGRFPGDIDAGVVREAGKQVGDIDVRRIKEVSAKLQHWVDLSADERLRLLNGDWVDSARRLSRWLELVDLSLERSMQGMSTTSGVADLSPLAERWASAIDAALTSISHLDPPDKEKTA